MTSSRILTLHSTVPPNNWFSFESSTSICHSKFPSPDEYASLGGFARKSFRVASTASRISCFTVCEGGSVFTFSSSIFFEELLSSTFFSLLAFWLILVCSEASFLLAFLGSSLTLTILSNLAIFLVNERKKCCCGVCSLWEWHSTCSIVKLV